MFFWDSLNIGETWWKNVISLWPYFRGQTRNHVRIMCKKESCAKRNHVQKRIMCKKFKFLLCIFETNLAVKLKTSLNNLVWVLMFHVYKNNPLWVVKVTLIITVLWNSLMFIFIIFSLCIIWFSVYLFYVLLCFRLLITMQTKVYTILTRSWRLTWIPKRYWVSLNPISFGIEYQLFKRVFYCRVSLSCWKS